MSQPSFNINSAFFLQQLDTTIIQLIKVIAVEHSVDINTAKDMAQSLIQDRINLALLTEENKKLIATTYTDFIALLKSSPNNTIYKRIYHIFKLLRLSK